MRMEKEKTVPPLYLAGALLLCLTIILIYQSFFIKEEVTMWRIELVGSDETYGTGEVVNLQMFLEDEVGMPIEDATVHLTLDRPDTVHNLDKVMHHVEGGLYEREVIFSLPGLWIGMVEVNRGRKIYLNQFLLKVEGPIISEEKRDPADNFNSNQPEAEKFFK
ncbi:FixH family protein [Bacillus solitudinis]|uniref:FixH family protein n=1 Tax=Bacillus solitudinis TaxID=2014074 RepID=UPI000C24CD68|nr:FixH family protein [Bacillus solitudinis]